MTTPNVPPGGATATGLPQNVAGAVAYVLGPITGILFLVMEKENRFVRFHAMQSTVVSIACIIASFALSFLTVIPILGWIVGIISTFVLGLGGFILWLFCMWKAFSGEEWEVPVAGPFARKQLGGTA